MRRARVGVSFAQPASSSAYLSCCCLALLADGTPSASGPTRASSRMLSRRISGERGKWRALHLRKRRGVHPTTNVHSYFSGAWHAKREICRARAGFWMPRSVWRRRVRWPIENLRRCCSPTAIRSLRVAFMFVRCKSIPTTDSPRVFWAAHCSDLVAQTRPHAGLIVQVRATGRRV